MNNNLPSGFISVDDAIELMRKDTRKTPVVDTSFMAHNYNFTRVGGNFTIPLLRREASGKIVNVGKTQTTFPDEESLWKFRGELKRHYRELSGRELEENPVRSLSTAIDPESNPRGQIQVNDKPLTRKGEDLGSGTKMVQE